MVVDGSPNVVTVRANLEIIESDKDLHFTATIAQNDKDDEDLTGLKGNKYIIDSIALQADQNLKFEIWFWHKDTKDDTDLDIDSFCGFVEIDLSTDGVQISGSNQYYYNKTGLQLLYEDEDMTKELHISLLNRSSTSKNPGSTGEVKLTIGALRLS
jgi:hypothetical protein